MQEFNDTKTLILEHFEKYPKMQLQDLFKFLFQSSFGCEHLVKSFSFARDYIIAEYERMKPTVLLVDKLDGDYSRVGLAILNDGLNPQTFAKLFYLSAKKEEQGAINLENKLVIAKELIQTKALPFDINEFNQFVIEWKNLNYPAIHHSQVFRENYFPCYRVIANEFIPLLPILTQIDIAISKSNFCIDIDHFDFIQNNFFRLSQIYSDYTLTIKNNSQSNKNYLQITIKE